jgi:hypothetical protein
MVWGGFWGAGRWAYLVRVLESAGPGGSDQSSEKTGKDKSRTSHETP